MRSWLLPAILSIAVFLTAGPTGAQDIPWASTWLSEWALSPVVVGDQMYTFIWSNWRTNTKFWYQKGYSESYTAMIDPWNDQSIYHETRSLIYKVTIIDNPSTPENEAVLNYFAQVGGGLNWDVEEGTATYVVTFDDDADFGSPLLTYEITPPDQVVNVPMPGAAKELYVSVLWDISAGYVYTFQSNVSFIQAEAPVPTENTSWGRVKALFTE